VETQRLSAQLRAEADHVGLICHQLLLVVVILSAVYVAMKFCKSFMGPFMGRSDYYIGFRAVLDSTGNYGC
jgi:hypothetical protein